MITGIYKITSPSKKVYIGQAFDIKKRWCRYKNLHCKSQPRLYKSFLKYGVEKHKFEILVQCSVEDLNEMERFYQDAFCVINEKGLNCVLTTASDRIGVFSADTRVKIGAYQKGKKMSAETKSKISAANKGRIVSSETCAKISAATNGRTMSLETREKLSTYQKNISIENRARISAAAKIISDEKRAKIIAANIGKKVSSETRSKMSASMKGRIVSDETRKKIGIAQKGKIVSAETREKISISIKAANKKKPTS